MTRWQSRRSFLGAVLFSAALVLAACGRKGSPLTPEDADPKAPRKYPVDRSLPAGQQAPAPDVQQQQPPGYPPPAYPGLPQPQVYSPFHNPLDQAPQ